MIDTHAHLDYSVYEEDFADVLRRAEEAGVMRSVCIATGLESSRKVVALAEQHPQLYAAVGVHPCNAHEEPESAIGEIEALCSHPKVVAIGEIGLDYYRLPEDREEAERMVAKQKQVFRALMEVAERAKKNVVVHQRSSWGETLDFLREYSGKVRCVLHCFGGTVAEAREVLAMGHLVSFTGIATFKNGGNVRAVAAGLQEGEFMLETDCPYLAPEPYRGKRCEPAYVREIAVALAGVRGETLESLAAHTTRVAEEFFSLPSQG